LRNSVLAGCILVALGTLAPGTVQAACGEECDSAYSSDIDDCRLKYGDDPADADDLANCIQEARDDYRSCLDDCASAMLAREAGAYVIGTGRAAHRQTALDFGAQEFVDLENDALEDVGGVDLVFDVFGGDIGKRSAGLIRAGGTLVTIAGPTEARPADGLAVDFVVVSDRAQLSEIVRRVRDGRLRTNIGNVSTLDEAVAAFNSTERRSGKTVIRVRP
jgi:hypothetical protein